MASHRKTRFDQYFTKRMKDPAFAAEYAAARAATNAVDTLVRSLDTAREDAGLTKAALAERADIKPEQVRRLFTAAGSNPTIATLVRLATALDHDIVLKRRVGRRPKPTRLAAREVRR